MRQLCKSIIITKNNMKKNKEQLYRKSLQNNLIDRSECESLCNVFTRYMDEEKK